MKQKEVDREFTHVRGDFLDHAWRIERRIAKLIALALVPGKDKEKRNALLSGVLGNQAVSFSVKCAMLREVVGVIPIEGIDKGVFKNIDKVRDFRNKLAHSVFDSDSNPGEQQI